MHSLDTGDYFLIRLERLEAHHLVGDSLHGSLVLLHDVVVVIRLAQLDVQAGIDVENGRSVGTEVAPVV